MEIIEQVYQSIETLQVYITNIELKYLWLGVGLNGPRAPKYRKAARLHRKYRKSIATYRNTAGLHKK